MKKCGDGTQETAVLAQLDGVQSLPQAAGQVVLSDDLDAAAGDHHEDDGRHITGMLDPSAVLTTLAAPMEHVAFTLSLQNMVSKNMVSQKCGPREMAS